MQVLGFTECIKKLNPVEQVSIFPPTDPADIGFYYEVSNIKGYNK